MAGKLARNGAGGKRFLASDARVSKTPRGRPAHEQNIGGVSTLGIEQFLQTDKPGARTKMSKRVSNALATLAFALLGVPLAVVAQ